MDLNALERLGHEVARQQDAELEQRDTSAAVRERLARHVTSRTARSKRRERARWASAAAAVATLAAGGLLWLRGAPEPPAITFETDMGRGVKNAPLHTDGDLDTELRFSEGSRVTLHGAARGRVLEMSPNGAELLVEEGTATVAVVPRPGGAWRVHSGPFIVDVTGTRFDVGWQPAADTLTVVLYSGSVKVTGCRLTDPLALTAGQRLEVSCDGQRLSVGPLDAKATGTAGTSTAGPPQPDVESGRAREPAGPFHAERPKAEAPLSMGEPKPRRERAERAPEAEARWVDLARAGRYPEAYAVADAAGFRSECEQRTPAEVMLLGDAARLSGHVDDARFAYSALRRRFQGTDSAARAGFNLARFDSRAGQHASAADGYRRYLGERPGGGLAAAALERLMESYAHLGRGDEARATARTYLSRYPSGARAEDARQLLASTPHGD